MKSLRTIKQSLLLPFWIMTGSVIVLALLSQLLIDDSLKNIKSDVEMVSIANDQSVRSLEIVKELAADKLEGEFTGMQLDSLIDRFNTVQQTMFIQNARLRKSYTAAYTDLDVAYNNFTASLDLVTGDIGNNLFLRLMDEQRYYLKQLDKFVTAINGYSDKKIKRFQWMQALIILGSIGVIILEALLIVLPALNKVKKQNIQLRKIAYHQSHLVRHPLVNIKGLLHLIEAGHNEEEKKQLLSLIKQEANHLDDIIHKTVGHTI